MSHKLLQQAVIADTENLGLTRGIGMHELAVYNLDTSELSEFILTPNQVQLGLAVAQENTGLATSSLDTHRLVRSKRWLDTIRATLVMEKAIEATASDDEVLKALEIANPWLSKSLANYPHLLGKVESASERARRLELMRKRGKVSRFTSEVVDPRDLLQAGGKLQDMIEGKIVWFANAPYDSKMVGALIGGLEAEGVSTELKRTMQTAGPTVDPFYVTGVEVNKARVEAQQTGDWTGVWRAYLADTPKPGQTAVRDIQDVLRAMTSYGQKLGLTAKGDVYWGSSLDLVYRLMGSLEDPNLLHVKESHRAAEDLAMHSRYVLERALNWTEALQEVHEGTERGKELLRLAEEGKGELFDVAAFFKRRDLLKPDILRVSLIQRLGRAQQDLMDQGKTWQTDGWRKVSQLTQTTPEGQSVKVPFLHTNRVGMEHMSDVVRLLVAQGKYGSEEQIAAELADMTRALEGGTNDVERKRLLTQYLDSKTSNIVDERISAISDNIVNTYNQNIGQTVSRALRSGEMLGEAGEALRHARVPALLKNWGMFAGAMATAGAVWSMTAGNFTPARETPSLVTFNYHQWLEQQAAFNDMRSPSEQNQGLSERGLAGATRSSRTDFGSPYQGIMGSQVVLHEQELLHERERWLREQYGAVHFDPVTGLFGMDGILARARHQGYSYLPGGEAVGHGYQSLRGRHLMKVNLGDGDWKLSVEDADTVVVKRGGLRGIVADLFGLNKGYSFRLAGVDAPETYHEGNYGGAQPHAYNSLEGLKTLLGKSSNVELVFDPTQTTYGRTMGVIFANGKNVNYELIKRGWAGHLPYGKPEESMIDYQVMKAMEQASAGSSRGMWQHPYWKVMYDTSRASGERMTFNTLTKREKIVENISTMDMLALMEQAQANGMYSTADAIEAARIGKFTHRGVDRVQPVITGKAAAHYNSYLHEMQNDISQYITQHGSGNPNRFSARGGYKNLDKTLVLDSMGHTNSVWSKRRLASFERYGVNNTQSTTRKHRMAMAQRNVNHRIFESQQRHYEY